MASSSSAQARLSVLSRQLGAVVERQDAKAEDDESVRPAPGGGRGTLTVVDNRTGKKYTVRMHGACGRARLQTSGGLGNARRADFARCALRALPPLCAATLHAPLPPPRSHRAPSSPLSPQIP